jgi:hypothetical protein
MARTVRLKNGEHITVILTDGTPLDLYVGGLNALTIEAKDGTLFAMTGECAAQVRVGRGKSVQVIHTGA